MRPWCLGCVALLLTIAAPHQTLLALPEYQMRYQQTVGFVIATPQGAGCGLCMARNSSATQTLPQKH